MGLYLGPSGFRGIEVTWENFGWWFKIMDLPVVSALLILLHLTGRSMQQEVLSLSSLLSQRVLAADGPSLGDWVCPARASGSTMASCPALVVASSEPMDSAPRTVVAAGAMGSLETLDVKSPRVVGRISGSRLVGATEDIHMPDNHAHGALLGSVGNPFSQVGLIMEDIRGRDTVEFFDAGSRLGPAPGCSNTASWAKCLEAFPGFGLLHPPLFPSWPKERPTLSSWILEERDGFRPRRSFEKAVLDRITLFYQASPEIPGQPRFFESGRGFWVVIVGEHYTSLVFVPDTTKRISESHVGGFVRQVAFSRSSSEGWMLTVVEVGGYYSDGDFVDLPLISLHPKLDTVHAVVLPFTGSSGEPGGSSVEGAWWHQDAPGGRGRFFMVNTQEGYENGESRETRVWAYELGSSGILKKGEVGGWSDRRG